MFLRKVFKPNFLLQDRIYNTFAKFDRAKVHVNVGTIGHIDHGKTSLTSAITKYLAAQKRANYVEYGKIDKAPEEKARGITINTATLQYETQKRHYAHVDCPGHIDYVKNMITGAAKMDAGILVVAATDGPMPQTKQHVLLCRQIGVEKILVFLNKMDLIKQQQVVDLIEEQIKELLAKHDYDPSKTAFIRGSALAYLQDTNPELGQKKLGQLLNAMDNVIPDPERPVDKPFMMSIENTYNIAGRGAVASGTIQQGRCKIGDDVQLIGYGKKLRTTVTGIQTFNKTLDYGEAGDNCGILVRGLTRQQMHRGLVMAKPNTLSVHSVLRANIYCLKESEGGRTNPFSTGYRPQLYFKTADTAAQIKLPQGTKIAMPGDNVSIEAKLNFPITIVKGARFALREGGKTIAAGVVTQILPEDYQIDFGKVKKGKPAEAAKPPAPGQDAKAPQGKQAGKAPQGKQAGKAPQGKQTGKTASKDSPQQKGKQAPKTEQKSVPNTKQAAKTEQKPAPSAPKGQSPPPKAPSPPPKAPTAPTGKTPPPPPPKAPVGKTPPPPPPKKK